MNESESIHDIGKDIEKRAYYLWEQAGRPEGNGWEFWLQAEGQLMDELRHKNAKPAAKKAAKNAAKKVAKKAVKKVAKKTAKSPKG